MLFNYRDNKRRAVSTIEYTMMVVLLFAAIVVMQKYIFRGMSGRWRSVSDTFGYGRQYDPAKTTECIYDMTINDWVGKGCFDSCIAKCDTKYGIGANLDCEALCPGGCRIADCQP